MGRTPQSRQTPRTSSPGAHPDPASQGRGASYLGGQGGVVDGEGLVRDPVPGVAGPRAVGRGDAERLELHRVGQQRANLLRQQGRPEGLHQDAGGSVDDGVEVGAVGGRDDGGAAGHGLDGGDGRGLVLVDVDHQVGRAQQRGEGGAGDLAGEGDPAVQVEGVGELGQAAVGQVAAQVLAGGAAGDDELGPGDPGHGLEQDGERIALGDQIGDGNQAVPVVPVLGGAIGGELTGVDAGGDHTDVAAGDAEAGQVGCLVAAAGDDGVDGASDGGLEADPLGPGAGRDQAVPPLGNPELVERLDDGDLEVAGGRQGGQAAGPAQRVDDVGAVLGPRLVQRGAERADLLDQVGVVAA